MVIWKFPIDPRGEFEVKATTSLRVLSTGIQDGKPYFWASLNPKGPECTFVFCSVMTGEDFADEVVDSAFWTFCGTVQLQGGAGNFFVLHLFQRVRPG